MDLDGNYDNTSRHCIIGDRSSFMKASHLTRTRYAHQVTALTLAKLQKDAYYYTKEAYSTKDEDKWRLEMVEKSQHSNTGIWFSTWN